MDNNGFNKTSLGMDENIEGMLCYVFGWLSGLIFFLIEKENRFVKFHGFQSFITFAILMAAERIAHFVPFTGKFISFGVWVLQFIVWAVMLYKAYKGEMYKLPITGDIAEKQIDRMM